VGGGDRAAAAWEILKILGHLGEEMGGKGKAFTRAAVFVFDFFFIIKKNYIKYIKFHAT
jgi:hypothetical protein